MDPILAAFLEHARTEPGAVIAIGSHAIVRRGELAERALGDAARIARARLHAGTLVGLVAPAGPGFLAAWLALRHADLVPVWIDAGTPDAERARIARGLGAAALWIAGEGWSGGELGRLESLVARDDARRVPQAASLKLTSGSTGEPAGIAVRAEELVADHRQLERSMGLASADRFLVVLPMSHSYGFSVLASPALLRGSMLVFPHEEDPREVAARHGVTVVPSVPSWYRTRAALEERGTWPECTRLFLSAGAPLAPEIARAWRLRTGRGIHVLYGSSECGGITYDRRGDAAERGSVGTPVDGVSIEIADAVEGTGRVVVRSPAVALGYVGADEDAERLGGGRFVTGDLARIEGGELRLAGRANDWINVKGRKVNPREVETVLGALDGVDEVAVLGQPLPDGRGELVRAVIACPEGALRYHDVVVWCRARLAAHKVPRSIHFVRELPRTERGKLDRAALLASPGRGARP